MSTHLHSPPILHERTDISFPAFGEFVWSLIKKIIEERRLERVGRRLIALFSSLAVGTRKENLIVSSNFTLSGSSNSDLQLSSQSSSTSSSSFYSSFQSPTEESTDLEISKASPEVSTMIQAILPLQAQLTPLKKRFYSSWKMVNLIHCSRYCCSWSHDFSSTSY
jgi:hypothetical protein